MHLQNVHGMKKATLYTLLTLMLVSLLGSCRQSHKEELDLAYVLAKAHPDSALGYLKHINQDKLSEKEMAKYALVYYMAQDKSGLDVDNDSLIRIAYDWYEKNQEDSLYALCLNYMGKYFMLNDSIEQAKVCLEKSYNLANKAGDTYLVSISLDKLVRIEGELNPYKAIDLAKVLMNVYSKHTELPLKNKVYARLRLSTSLIEVDSLHAALKENLLALNDAKVLNDSDIISDVCLDLSSIYGEQGQKDSSLYYAKTACSLSKTDTITCRLALASAFCDVDSIKEMFTVLNGLNPNIMEDKNTISYLKVVGAIKAKNIDFAINYTDSANNNYDDAYRKAMQGKYTYYSSYINKVKEKAELRGKNEMQRWVFLLSILLLISLLAFILYVYFINQKQAALKIRQEKELAATQLAHEQELYEQEILMADKLHKEELAHKETQLSAMRNYLLKKIEIVEKLNSIREKDVKHIVLSEDDWVELEMFLDGVEDRFVARLKMQHPNLTQSDIRLMMLLRLKLPQKSLASIYCISEKAVKQKLFLYKERVGIQNEQISLRKYIETF